MPSTRDVRPARHVRRRGDLASCGQRASKSSRSSRQRCRRSGNPGSKKLRRVARQLRIESAGGNRAETRIRTHTIPKRKTHVKKKRNENAAPFEKHPARPKSSRSASRSACDPTTVFICVSLSTRISCPVAFQHTLDRTLARTPVSSTLTPVSSTLPRPTKNPESQEALSLRRGGSRPRRRRAAPRRAARRPPRSRGLGSSLELGSFSSPIWTIHRSNDKARLSVGFPQHARSYTRATTLVYDTLSKNQIGVFHGVERLALATSPERGGSWRSPRTRPPAPRERARRSLPAPCRSTRRDRRAPPARAICGRKKVCVSLSLSLSLSERCCKDARVVARERERERENPSETRVVQ